MITLSSKVTRWWQNVNEPIILDLSWLKPYLKFLPVVFCICAVYGCGLMVGIVQHKIVLCYSFSAWFFGVIGLVYVGWLILDRVTEPIK